MMSACSRPAFFGVVLSCSMAAAVWAPSALAEDAVEPVHGVAMHGDLAYPADFEHLAYANPNAPKGGSLTLSALGSFDSFNPYIIKGQAASGLGLIYETLTTRSLDEPFFRIWPARREHRDARGPLLGGLYPQSKCALA